MTRRRPRPSYTTTLSFDVGGMIAIVVATGPLGLIQTLLSSAAGSGTRRDAR